MNAGAPGMNSRKSRDRAMAPSGADFKRRTVVTGANSPTLETSRPRLSASFDAIFSISSASFWAPSGKGIRFAAPEDIRQALPSETGEPSGAAAVIVFDRMPADFSNIVISRGVSGVRVIARSLLVDQGRHRFVPSQVWILGEIVAHLLDNIFWCLDRAIA